MTIAMTPEVTAGTGAVRILLEVSYQLSAISHQLSAFSHQLPLSGRALSHQALSLSARNFASIRKADS
jgi:hypothetical protein